MIIRGILRRSGPALLVASLCLGATTALADNLKTITIGAGVLTKTVVDHSVSTGAPIEEVVITHRVSYADLDLRTQAGAAELQRRVHETARTACKQLDDLYPLERKQARDCTQTAITAASLQVKNAIAGVRRQAKAE